MAGEKRPRQGRNVFILGAGASVHAGIPLLEGFVRRARSLATAEGRVLRYDKQIKVALDWMSGLRALAYYVDINVDNLEHVFSLAQVAKEAGKEGADEIYDSLRLLIGETIDQSCNLIWGGDPERPKPDDTYYAFLKLLLEELGGRDRLAQGNVDPIITFNYDVLLDHAMYQWQIRPDYSLGRELSEDWPPWPLYKLHGSLNWAIHPKCEKPAGKQISLLAPKPDPKEYEGFVVSDFVGPRPFRMATSIMDKQQCPGCHQEHVLMPAVMPPTWSKSPSEYGIEKVWGGALRAISTATQIIIIGYSLPQTDTFFAYLLALGLESNHGLLQILVVNPDKTEGTEDRYKHIFAGRLSGRQSFVYEPLTFEQAVRGGFLKQAIHIADVG